MTRMIALLGLCITMSLSFNVKAAEYKLDKKGQHVFITFKASHLGYSYIIGHFEDFEGSFSFRPDDPGKSRAKVSIDVKSLDTDHAERDKHLRSSDYLDADKYPKVTFVSTGYRGNASLGELKGDLSLHGVTRSVALKIKKIGEGKDPWGGYRAGFEGTVTLKAADYGLPAYVGDVEVYVVVEGVRQS